MIVGKVKGKIPKADYLPTYNSLTGLPIISYIKKLKAVTKKKNLITLLSKIFQNGNNYCQSTTQKILIN